uniref:Uncharacterized protein n=1 Tax=Arundo donax TaxID=35708 RepID=A0A0A8ZSV0_ARUDO
MLISWFESACLPNIFV